MSTSVLVAYSTSYGSTQEVAEAISDTLRECGLVVDIQPAREAQKLSGYSGIVLGAPLFMGRCVNIGINSHQNRGIKCPLFREWNVRCNSLTFAPKGRTITISYMPGIVW